MRTAAAATPHVPYQPTARTPCSATTLAAGECAHNPIWGHPKPTTRILRHNHRHHRPHARAASVTKTANTATVPNIYTAAKPTCTEISNERECKAVPSAILKAWKRHASAWLIVCHHGTTVPHENKATSRPWLCGLVQRVQLPEASCYQRLSLCGPPAQAASCEKMLDHRPPCRLVAWHQVCRGRSFASAAPACAACMLHMLPCLEPAEWKSQISQLHADDDEDHLGKTVKHTQDAAVSRGVSHCTCSSESQLPLLSESPCSSAALSLPRCSGRGADLSFS